MSGITVWLQDSHNPNGEHTDYPRWSVLVRLAIAAGIVAAFAVYAWPWLLHESGIEPWGIYLLLGAYLLVGYFMKPRVDTGDLEWWNLIFDNPFSYHDDIDRNKFFLFFAVLLICYPAHFVTHALVDFVVLLINLTK